jgi:hypothetical protein
MNFKDVLEVLVWMMFSLGVAVGVSTVMFLLKDPIVTGVSVMLTFWFFAGLIYRIRMEFVK